MHRDLQRLVLRYLSPSQRLSIARRVSWVRDLHLAFLDRSITSTRERRRVVKQLAWPGHERVFWMLVLQGIRNALREMRAERDSLLNHT